MGAVLVHRSERDAYHNRGRDRRPLAWSHRQQLGTRVPIDTEEPASMQHEDHDTESFASDSGGRADGDTALLAGTWYGD